ncbi:MAG: GTP-binding protein [Bryobacterales bacterium]|nr:GTP-binding protein [Bryobacterales bacterium]
MIQKKICMVGAYGVGKTSLVKRFVESIFDERYHTTVGVKIDKKRLQMDDGELTLVLWDLAGDDELEPLRLSYLRGASGYILVADGCRESTLDIAGDLHSRIAGVHGALPFVLAVNKMDLEAEWRISEDRLARVTALGWPLIRTSAKTGAGVDKTFSTLASLLLQDLK